MQTVETDAKRMCVLFARAQIAQRQRARARESERERVGGKNNKQNRKDNATDATESKRRKYRKVWQANKTSWLINRFNGPTTRAHSAVEQLVDTDRHEH